VPEPVGGHRELDRHVRLVLPPVEAAVDPGVRPALVEDRGEHVGADHSPQEVVHDQPLVVPPHDPLGRLERGLAAPPQRRVVLHQVDHLVVELEHGELQLADEGVLVVAGIAEQRGVLLVAGQVVLVVVVADEELLAVRGLVVEERIVDRPAPVHAVEIEARAAEIGQRVRVVLPVQARHRVEGEIVVDELPEVGVTRRDVGVVGLGTRPGRVLLHQGGDLRDPLIAGHERRQPEHPAESALVQPGHRNVGKATQLSTVAARGAAPVTEVVRRGGAGHELFCRARGVHLRNRFIVFDCRHAGTPCVSDSAW
jgi:hypothetical protein